MTLSEDELRELEALCERATPGPWVWEDTRLYPESEQDEKGEEWRYTAGLGRQCLSRHHGDSYVPSVHSDTEPPILYVIDKHTLIVNPHDARLICLAREALPQLITTIRELRAQKSGKGDE